MDGPRQSWSGYHLNSLNLNNKNYVFSMVDLFFFRSQVDVACTIDKCLPKVPPSPPLMNVAECPVDLPLSAQYWLSPVKFA